MDTDHFAELVGIEVLDAQDGYAKVQLKIGKQHTNALGFAHGGAIFAVADYAFAQASNFGENKAVGGQVSINYLKPSTKGDVLVAEATRINNGKTTSLYHVTREKRRKTGRVFFGFIFQKIVDKTVKCRQQYFYCTLLKCMVTHAGVAESLRR